MESYKDVIISQKPAMYQQTPNILLENYKGILLCSRPVDLPHSPSTQLRGDAVGVAPPRTAGGEPLPAFVPGGKMEQPLGLGPSLEGRTAMERGHRKRVENTRIRRAEVSGAILRHRRWLRSFAEQVRKMKKEELQQEIDRAHRAEYLRKRRESRKQEATNHASKKMEETQATPVEGEQHPPPYSQNVAFANDTRGGDDGNKNGGELAVPSVDGEKSKKRSAKAKRKPKWALTEDEALDDELAEANDLLDFAKNLDYEKFISDYEVAGALAIMRERVEEIARENNWSNEVIEGAANDSLAGDTDDEEGGEDRSDAPPMARRQQKQQTKKKGTVVCTAAAEGHAAGHQKGWDKSVSVGCVLKRAIMREALLLAERILASSVSMQKIHTKFSLARLLQRCVLTGRDVNEEMQKPSIGGTAGLETVPRVVKLHPDATGLEVDTGGADGGGQQRVLIEMQRSKERTQGLPYLYRCPAI